ncbi:DNA methylase [Bordetella pertussis]|nr:DNA methylase [Bordetella pertussis]
MAGPGRLIDEGLSFYEASLAGKAERYGRGETPHTIHVWWARRPHSAMRALVYAALLAEAAAELAGQYGDRFRGGAAGLRRPLHRRQ